ncbi:restriction endonuclease subunit S [Paracoccus homiensis]|uniref:restriction endonuclease subunit S n=1 Tax=Paracoccus homiensis TaxID=364199 RepID=UPI00398CDC05
MSSKGKSIVTKDGASVSGPKLRFPEFQGTTAWRTKKLNSLLFEAKHRNRSLELGPADVLSVSGEHGCVNQIEFMGRSYAGATVKDYHVVEHGDIVYTKSPLKKNPFGIIKENKGKRGIVSTLYAVYRPFPECYPTYLDHFFSVDYHLNSYLQPIVRKGAKNDMKVNNADVLKGDICVPDLNEQKKIANCLDSADSLIAAQRRKVEALRAHKKGLMQQLFPQEGETQPRRRFPDFEGAGDWAPRTVGSVCTSFSGGTPSTSNPEFYGGDIPFIRSAEIGKATTELSLTREGLENSAAKMIKKGDVLVALYGANSGDVAIARISGAINQAILCLRPSGNGAFLAQFLTHRKDWITTKYLQGGQGNLSGEIVKSVALGFPSPKEQQRIGDCLSSLDDLIAAEARKLETLKTHKKGLMQQLFPRVAEGDA